jgi:DNA recombination-mediator protein A
VRVFNYLRSGVSYVAIVGSRYLPPTEKQRVATFIGQLPENCTVVSGGAPGVDSWAESLAVERGLRCAVVRPSAKGMRLAADYFGRNKVIVRGSQCVVAFWNSESRGTPDSINEAIDFHGHCVVVEPGRPSEIWRERR